jgi:Uma2 family endonuclease
VEDLWGFPGADVRDDGDIADVQPLWPGIQSGRPKPTFSYSIDEQAYLDFEEKSDTKHEYVDGYVYAMAGASDAHNTIAGNLVALIRPLLRGTGCKGYFSDMRMAISGRKRATSKSGAYYYPDYFITCSKTDLHPDAKTIKKEPRLVVEVLSPGSTASVDRTEKLDRYQRIPSLEQYWLVEQDHRRVVVYTSTDAGWLMTEHTDDEVMLALPLPGLAIRLGDLYEDVFGV